MSLNNSRCLTWQFFITKQTGAGKHQQQRKSSLLINQSSTI